MQIKKYVEMKHIETTATQKDTYKAHIDLSCFSAPAND